MNTWRVLIQRIFLAFVFLLLPGAASFAQIDPSKPLRLGERESADLVAFLESLTERESALPARRASVRCLP